MKAKVLEMVDLLAGSFEKMTGDIAIEGLEGVDLKDYPQPIRELRDFISSKLSAARESYEEVAVSVVSKYFTEEDIDAVIAYNKSEAGQKMRKFTLAAQNEFVDEVRKWRNTTLEPYAEDVKRMLGVVEPVAAKDHVASAATGKGR